jgi:NAD(P)-dependent dehydrogenase (short-subunit alcohol dehydrogenase family)
MRERGGGCIINIASRSGTVDVPMTLGYVTSKAALIRATHTLQMEMKLDNLDPAIHMYALHPGGVLTGMGAGTSFLLLEYECAFYSTSEGALSTVPDTVGPEKARMGLFS